MSWDVGFSSLRRCSIAPCLDCLFESTCFAHLSCACLSCILPAQCGSTITLNFVLIWPGTTSLWICGCRVVQLRWRTAILSIAVLGVAYGCYSFEGLCIGQGLFLCRLRDHSRVIGSGRGAVYRTKILVQHFSTDIGPWILVVRVVVKKKKKKHSTTKLQ